MKKSDKVMLELAEKMERILRRSMILSQKYTSGRAEIEQTPLREEYNSLWDQIMEAKPKGLAGVLAQILCLSHYHDCDQVTVSALASAIPIIKRAANC